MFEVSLRVFQANPAQKPKALPRAPNVIARAKRPSRRAMEEGSKLAQAQAAASSRELRAESIKTVETDCPSTPDCWAWRIPEALAWISFRP